MKYFAYDDKMFSPILRSILPEVRFIGVGQVKGYNLFFHNRDQVDHSGKCNLIKSNDASHTTYGVVYEVLPRERHLLDKAQKLGYGNQEITVKVLPVENEVSTLIEPFYAFTYVAHKERVFSGLEPFTWYKELVIEGAKEHCLPEVYIKGLEDIEAASDPNVTRAKQYQQFLAQKVL